MLRKVTLYEWVCIALLVVASIAWAVRLEARVDSLANQVEAFQEYTERTYQQIRQDLAYIRSRVDDAIDRSQP